jgi:N-methylhydantoinase A
MAAQINEADRVASRLAPGASDAPKTAPSPPAAIRIGVDVGGTFSDLVAFDGQTLRIIKIPSTPPDFHIAVIDAVGRIAAGAPDAELNIVHGSTVATNALLQRTGAPIAFVTTQGFGDMLLIGRQDRPELYALNIQRPPPLAPSEHCFTVRERIDARGDVVEPLTDDEVRRLIEAIAARGLKHVAVCLLFSFINPEHEERIAAACAAAGLTCSLSSRVLSEFREFERASTTAINATLRPVVHDYLAALQRGLPARVKSLRIMQSGGGTLGADEAATEAARLVLSGPAGGVIGAAMIARAAGLGDVITYDMGGTSTDVATLLNGQPQWTTHSAIDGLPLALPMFDIHTVGAGGGSIAYLDIGGALRVGPRSAGANPGPACYGRGGTDAAPTVTDANVVLGRIVPERFLGGAMRIIPERARAALAQLGARMNKGVIETALGVIRIAEANMERAIREVTSQRGHDPRQFALVSFGGAGGLHACALAEGLDIPRVLIPPHCGVLSALGMAGAPAIVDASRTVLHLGHQLDDERLPAEFGSLSGQTIDQIPHARTARVEAHADVRFAGQSHELMIRVERPTLAHIHERFLAAYELAYGAAPKDRAMQIVTLRIRRIGHAPQLTLPPLAPDASGAGEAAVILPDGSTSAAPALPRAALLARGGSAGPLLLLDDEATTFVPPGWSARCEENGAVMLMRG